MKVSQLIKYLQGCNQDANVCVTGNGKGASPFIDLDPDDFHETEDYEVGDRVTQDEVPSTVHTDESGTEFRKVVVLFHSDELY